MKASWLVLVVLAGLLLLLTTHSEDAPTVPGAPELVTLHSEHPPIEVSRISKAWWKKFIQESQRQKQPPTPKTGVFGPLSGNDPNDG